ncbi:MAG TPA: Bax inhibitor-1/YccA family protein [Pseudonocardiaceae bacterium]
MRTSSNPAFRNLPAQGAGHATFNQGGGQPPLGYGAGYGVQTPATGRPMTIDDVVTKTGATLAVLVVTGALTWASGMYFLALPAAIIGLVLSLVIIFVRKLSTNPALILAYAAFEGVFLGGISGIFNDKYDGIVIQAVVGTAAVFGGMLVVYKTGAIRVTPKFTRWIVGAMIGVFGLMLVNLLASFFVEGGLGLRNGGALAIIFSLVCIGIAAFSFLLDFDQADQAIREGVPARFAWYVAFGLTVTLVWLYLEILRLLSYFRE